MGRFIVIVLDGFGVGEMKNDAQRRKQDIGANTALHIIQAKPSIKIPLLEKLGLMNAIGCEHGGHCFSREANWGTANLAHSGADSFLGHQEIVGTKPGMPPIQFFYEKIDEVEAHLISRGYRVRRVGEAGKPQILVVNECATIGDNLETDYGQVHNVTGCFDLISFEELKKIGRLVREVVDVSRVIVFGGKGVGLENLLAARKTPTEKIAGVDAPESSVYNRGYEVIHLGHGIDPNGQAPTILDKNGLYVALFGKAADIVQTESRNLFPGADSETLLDALLAQIKAEPRGFFLLNIQETDLAGHSEDIEYYADRLELCDKKIGAILNELAPGDILLITGDHGNDPTIGHSNHTREKTPLLIYSPGITGREIGERETLADIAATAVCYFNAPPPQNGASFLEKII